MNAIRHIAAGTGIWFALLTAVPGQAEDPQFFFGTNAYPASILDHPRSETEAEHPELLRPPIVGDAFAYRVFRGGVLARQIAATVVSATVLDCAEGPEIALHPGDLRLDLFRALYLTDILHRSPQILDETPPRDPVPAPTFNIFEPGSDD